MIFNALIPRPQRKAFFYDSIAAVLVGLYVVFTINFVGVVARRMGAPDWLMACLTATTFIGALFSYQWSKFSIRRHPVEFFFGFRIASRTLMFLLSFVTKPEWFLPLMLVYWVIEMGTVPCYSGIMKQVYPDDVRSKIMGYARTEMAIVSVIFSLIAGKLLDYSPDSFRWVFPIGIVFGVFSLLTFRRIPYKYGLADLDSSIARELVPLGRARDILAQDERLRRYQTINSLYGFGNIIAFPYYSIFMVDALKLSNTEIGFIGSVYSAFWCSSYLLWGHLIHRRGSPLQILPLVFFLNALVPFFYLVAWDATMLYVAAACNGIISGGIDLGRSNYLLELAPEDKVQSYSGVDFTIMGFRGITAPFVGVLLVQIFNVRLVFALSAALVMLSAYLIHRHRAWDRKFMKAKRRLAAEATTSPLTPTG